MKKIMWLSLIIMWVFTSPVVADEGRETDQTPPSETYDNLIVAPNPYLPKDEKVLIRFDINQDTFDRAEVRIYNIAAEWIADIKADAMEEEAHPNKRNVWVCQGEWDVKNHDGQDVASGVYLLHIVAVDSKFGKKEETVKLAVIR